MGYQTSVRERARLAWLSLRQSGLWLAETPKYALGLHLFPNEIWISVMYTLGFKVHDFERKRPYCNPGTVEAFTDYAVVCYERGDGIAMMSFQIATKDVFLLS